MWYCWYLPFVVWVSCKHDHNLMFNEWSFYGNGKYCMPESQLSYILRPKQCQKNVGKRDTKFRRIIISKFVCMDLHNTGTWNTRCHIPKYIYRCIDINRYTYTCIHTFSEMSHKTKQKTTMAPSLRQCERKGKLQLSASHLTTPFERICCAGRISFNIVFGVEVLTWHFFLSEWRRWGKEGREGERESDISGAFWRHLSPQDLPAALAFPETGHY